MHLSATAACGDSFKIDGERPTTCSRLRAVGFYGRKPRKITKEFARSSTHKATLQRAFTRPVAHIGYAVTL